MVFFLVGYKITLSQNALLFYHRWCSSPAMNLLMNGKIVETLFFVGEEHQQRQRQEADASCIPL